MSTTNQFKALSILMCLYMAQGLPFGFFTQAMPSLMREQGVDLRVIGLMSLLALPWAIKFLWAPFLDRYSVFGISKRKGWILLANVLAVSFILLLATQSLQEWLGPWLMLLMLCILGLNLFAATQDISTDALAVESVNSDKRGWVNGIQVSGYRLGMLLGGGLLLGWLPVLGWQTAMLVLAVMLLLVSLPVLMVPGQAGSENILEAKTQGNVFGEFKGLFCVKGIGFWLVLLVLYKAGDAFGTAMLKPMLIDQGLGLQDIAWYLGTWGVAAGLLGAVLGGLLIKPLGRFRALWLFALLQTISLSAYGLLSAGLLSMDLLLVLVVLEHVTGAMATIAVFTIMMDACRPSHAGLDYSFQSCLIIISGLILGGFSGFSAHSLGYAMHFALAAALTLLACGYVFWQRKSIGKVWA